ncbi:hypothetical protein [Leyella stercorea]|uniref:hypothetical protein n=1 Tax=Leyella stercorea TaxID=363265 RepID=UPI0002F56E63|nr:hypothetical protein [Leyella stercorea]
MTIVLCFCHPHRPMQTSAPTDADIRTDRRRRPHRPTHAIRGATLHAHSITTHPKQ